MGDVVVLRPQTVLKDHMPQTLIFPQMKSRRRPNPNPRNSPNRRKRSPTGPPNRKPRPAAAERSPARNPAIGQVKILKRGEDPNANATVKKAEKLCEIVDDLYAGAAFVESPPPSSLPIPSFSGCVRSASLLSNDAATSELLRLLKL